ncbi:hypothetical protein LPMP_292060 [Leishmania panamensis]|uniref:Uncharacterized protein n=1 Tax=Leishmania panamensis TaxID=5679 RepID=A0A088RVL4_LEIPA|nr:hypothetical protein LPMP_292060 [Leishmania panamensis]AIO00153.1 hypothetical protein LPMP_292060 [Leishmania panamensis]
MHSNSLTDDEGVLGSLSAASADAHVKYEPMTAATNEEETLRHENFHEHDTTVVAEHDEKSVTANASATRLDETQPALLEADNEEAVDEGDDDDDSKNGGDGAYAAEYRSLLFRVAEMEAQEQQRDRQSDFALRMAQREAKLMAEVAAQQQMFLASQALSASCLHSSGSAKTSPNASAESRTLTATSAADASPNAKDIAAAVATDARLACLAHRMEHAQLQYERCTEAVRLLRSHARSMQADAERQEKLKTETAELLGRLHENAGLAGRVMTSTVEESSEEHDCARPLTASPPTRSPPSDMWQKHISDMTTLGGTLAKVHTLFRDPDCRTNMSVVATALTEVGRRCQSLLQELQALTEAEVQTEADLRQRRAHSLEWSLFAANAQQAREMQDLYSPVTIAETRAMGLRKVLLRRRKELQNALTLAILRDAEKAVSSIGYAADASSSASVPQPPSIFFSQPCGVTPEEMKAVTDTCARREGLRDRLCRELLYLKKCARRVLGSAWVSQAEATALTSLAETADVRGDSQMLEAVLEDGLRWASYDGLAHLVVCAASTPKPKDEQDDGHRGDISDVNEDVAGEGKVQDESDGLTSLPHSHPSAPVDLLATRVQVLSLLEALQTRANSLVSLLAENAKHWQRTHDVWVEAEMCASSSEDAWCRTAELLLRRCTDMATVEILSSGARDDDADLHIACASPLLLQEQQLLNSLHASQEAITEAVNAALAQVHHGCAAPLEREKREVALLIRLLQLSDEAGAPECQGGNSRSTDLLVTHTTPALESAMQLLKLADDDAHESDSADPSVATCDAGKERCLAQVHLPQLPRRVDVVQDAISVLSAKWKETLAAETAAIRTKFTEMQVKLDQYAQYSMAEVPSLLEKALAEAKSLQARASECTTRNSQTASLAAQVEQQRKLLTDSTTTERYALTAAVQQARLEVAALQAQVAQLQMHKDLSAAESLHRCEVREAEAVTWKSLLLDHLGQREMMAGDGARDGAIEDGDVSDINQETSAPILETATDMRTRQEERNQEIDGSAAELEVASLKREDEADGPEIMKTDEAGADVGDAEGGDDEKQQFVDESAKDDALNFDGETGEYHTTEEVSENEQGDGQSRNDDNGTEYPVSEEPGCTTVTGTSHSMEAVLQVEVKRQYPLLQSGERKVKRRQRRRRQHPSILGEAILGQAESGQRPPVFESAAGIPFLHQPPPPVLPSEPTTRPVYEDNPFYSGFGFEEE